jgi:hypothetical protein
MTPKPTSEGFNKLPGFADGRATSLFDSIGGGVHPETGGLMDTSAGFLTGTGGGVQSVFIGEMGWSLLKPIIWNFHQTS